MDVAHTSPRADAICMTAAVYTAGIYKTACKQYACAMHTKLCAMHTKLSRTEFHPGLASHQAGNTHVPLVDCVQIFVADTVQAQPKRFGLLCIIFHMYSFRVCGRDLGGEGAWKHTCILVQIGRERLRGPGHRDSTHSKEALGKLGSSRAPHT